MVQEETCLSHQFVGNIDPQCSITVAINSSTLQLSDFRQHAHDLLSISVYRLALKERRHTQEKSVHGEMLEI